MATVFLLSAVMVLVILGLAILGLSFVVSWIAHKIRSRYPAKYAPKPPWME
jgi:hypothetical protein